MFIKILQADDIIYTYNKVDLRVHNIAPMSIVYVLGKNGEAIMARYELLIAQIITVLKTRRKIGRRTK